MEFVESLMGIRSMRETKAADAERSSAPDAARERRRGGVAAIARLELGEVVRSRWMVFCLVVYGLLAAFFVLVGLRESSVLGFTGMGRALLSFTHALVLLLPLLGLTATGQVVNAARDDGTLELLFGHPIGRTRYFVAVTLVRLVLLVAPLVVLVLGMALYGRMVFHQPIGWLFVLRALAVSTALLACSVCIGLMVSTMVRNQAKALILLLFFWACGVALIDFGLIGMMLQWRMSPSVTFALATLNPVQCARMALLSGADPELTTLGPVGFFLANRIGTGGLFAIGVAWPVLVASAAWALALQRFRSRDLI
ncbi:MAG: ABC transporter permease subunit [Planctomycetes bacterium]|nr:ABC transporter permease subunit [Planctomycetota bacterium]